MFQKDDAQRGAKLFRRARLGRRAGADRRFSTEKVISALAAVALASAAWSAPVSANEPMLLLAPASAPDDAVTRSEVVVSLRADGQGRLVREVMVRLVVVEEAPWVDLEIAPDSRARDRRSLKTLAKEALYDAFQAAESAFDQVLEPFEPPETEVPKLFLVPEIATSTNIDGLVLGNLSLESDFASRRIIGRGSVPEPSTLALFVAASIPLWSRKRDKYLIC